jgi:hypothetical protein
MSLEMIAIIRDVTNAVLEVEVTNAFDRSTTSLGQLAVTSTFHLLIVNDDNSLLLQWANLVKNHFGSRDMALAEVKSQARSILNALASVRENHRLPCVGDVIMMNATHLYKVSSVMFCKSSVYFELETKY